MEACGPLAEYAWPIEEIRKNGRDSMSIEAAVDKAIDDMPVNFVIRDYLIGNRAEARNMCITEYSEAETMQVLKEEGRKKGGTKIKMYSFIFEQQNSVDFNFPNYCEAVPETDPRRKKNTGIFSTQWLIRLPV